MVHDHKPAVAATVLVATALVLSSLPPARSSAASPGFDGTWTESAKLVASDAEQWEYFGESVALDDDTLAISTTGFDLFTGSSGSVYVFKRTQAGWEEVTELRGSDLDESGEAWFGASVAVSGNTIIVGAPLVSESDPLLRRSGAVYVFTRSGKDWSETARLTAGDAQAEARFGQSVSVDGETLVVGAWGHDDQQGAAYVFTSTDDGWIETAKLTAPDAPGFFGSPVAVGGNTIAVGAAVDDTAGTDAGSMYVFSRTRFGWEQAAKLLPSDATAYDRFPTSLAVSGDTIVAGSRLHDGSGSNSGAAYVFDGARGRWFESAKLTPAGSAEFDFFGRSVDFERDLLVVGATGADVAGAAFIFTRGRTGWSQETTLIASDSAVPDGGVEPSFGRSIALDAKTIAVGAWGRDGVDEDTGSAYVFTFVANA